MEQAPNEPILTVVFYKTGGGNEPVREWLKGLKREDRKTIGEDIKTVQFGWPLGMPLIRKVEPGIWGKSAQASVKASHGCYSQLRATR